MATYIVGGLLMVLFVAAARHVYKNMKAGKNDCCGCDGCSGCSCHSHK